MKSLFFLAKRKEFVMKQKDISLSEAEQLEVVQKLCDFLKEKYEVACMQKTILFWEKGTNSGYVCFRIVYDSKYISTGPLGF
ncbi:MAG: hypothetical protein LUH08_05925 [Ruminococcus sp.]|nr:hypothetical protein [Ruminococcus sp.]